MVLVIAPKPESIKMRAKRANDIKSFFQSPLRRNMRATRAKVKSIAIVMSAFIYNLSTTPIPKIERPCLMTLEVSSARASLLCFVASSTSSLRIGLCS